MSTTARMFEYCFQCGDKLRPDRKGVTDICARCERDYEQLYPSGDRRRAVVRFDDNWVMRTTATTR